MSDPISGEAAAPVSRPSLIRQPIPCQAVGCSRNATKASGFAWCYWCDPSVPLETKQAARSLGGRRGLMASTEAALLLDGAILTAPDGRQDVRARLMAARAGGKLGAALYRDLLAGIDSAARDQERNPKTKPPVPVLVEMTRYGEASA